MAQQTAVEWLENQFDKYTSGVVNVPNSKIFKLTEKAKQMEKKQIMTAWLSGDADSMYEPKQLDEQAEQYYNETFKK